MPSFQPVRKVGDPDRVVQRCTLLQRLTAQRVRALSFCATMFPTRIGALGHTSRRDNGTKLQEGQTAVSLERNDAAALRGKRLR